MVIALGAPTLAISITSCVLLGVVLIAVVIVRWRGFRLTAAVDRVVVYSILAALLLSFYAGASLAATLLIQSDDVVKQGLAAVAMALFVAVTYAPASKLIQRLVDLLLYHDYYDYEATLQRFSQQLASAHEHEAVVNVLLDGLVETLNLTGAGYVPLPDSLDQGALTVVGPDDVRARGMFATSGGREELLRRLVSLNIGSWRLTPAVRLSLSPWRGCGALLLIGGDPGEGSLALLALGTKRAGGPLRREDGALLLTLSHQAATALSNAQLVSGLRISLQQLQLSATQLVEARSEQELLLRELVNAEERERAALARDLHDDALQEVLYTIRHAQLAERLADTVEQQAQRFAPLPVASSSPNDSVIRITTSYQRLRQELAGLAERSAIAEKKLRALCLGLYPEILPSLGLTPALEDLAEQVSGATGMQVEVSCDEPTVRVTGELAPETALHLYRIAQEALTNAAKHGAAANALVRLSARVADRERGEEPDALTLEITDDGKGIAIPVDIGQALAQGHLGLASMRERALLIHARLSFEAPSGGGSRVTVVAPARAHAAAM
jgi:signal transduction histidine kinase